MEVRSSKKTMKALSLSGIFGSLLLLAGCGQFAPLPDEQRYQYINAVLEDLDYEDTGTVTESGYDENDGIISPSYYYAVIEGSETFDTLSKRIQSLENVKCTAVLPDETRCRVGQADIYLNKESDKNNSVVLKVLDTYSGRNPND